MTPAAVVARLRAAGCVFAEEEAAHLLAAAPAGEALESMVARRVAGVPLEHVLGYAEFAGVRLEIAEGVFVPRHRTQLLTATARRLVRDGATVLDLCCGTGALGLVVARESLVVARESPGVALESPGAARESPGAARGGPSGVRLVATDIDPAAVACARRNLAGVTAEVFEGDLFAPLPPDLRGRVDVLLANVPYVPTAQIAYLPEEFRVHEARAALDGGGDGLDVLRRVAAEAPAWLAPGGALLTEAGPAQLDTAHAVLRAAGLHPATVTDEETETHVVVARR
jgi:release factor glutamine methyltransferase